MQHSLPGWLRVGTLFPENQLGNIVEYTLTEDSKMEEFWCAKI
jgi:hypothetical protein